MPIIEIEGLGRVEIEGDTPNEVETQAIINALQSSQAREPSVPSPLTTDDAPGSAFGMGLSSGIDVVQTGYLSALEGLGKVTGLEGLEEYGAEGVAEQERQLAEAEPYATRRQDVEGLGSGLTFVGETIGEQVLVLPMSERL